MPKKSEMPLLLPSDEYYGTSDIRQIGTNKNSAKREFNRLVLSTPKNRRYQILVEATFEDKNGRKRPIRFGKMMGVSSGDIRGVRRPCCPSEATHFGKKPDFEELYTDAMRRGVKMASAGDEWENAISGSNFRPAVGSVWVVRTIHAVHLVVWRTLKRPKRGRLTKKGELTGKNIIAVGKFKRKSGEEKGGEFISTVKVKPLVFKYKKEKETSKKEQAALERKYAAPESRVKAFKRLEKKNVAMKTRALKRKVSK